MILQLRRCPQHAYVSHWVEAWVDPDDHRAGREYRCVVPRSESSMEPCDLVMSSRPVEFAPVEEVLEAAKKAAARTSTPRLIRDNVERELRRRKTPRGRP